MTAECQLVNKEISQLEREKAGIDMSSKLDSEKVCQLQDELSQMQKEKNELLQLYKEQSREIQKYEKKLLEKEGEVSSLQEQVSSLNEERYYLYKRVQELEQVLSNFVVVL
jgi:chromosome segregation ATPase